MKGKIGKDELVAILNDWNSWKKPLPGYVPRAGYSEKLERLSKSRQVVIVTGARRAGKSVLMHQAIGALIAKGAPKENALFVNLEDPRFPPLDLQLLDLIFETYLEFLAPKGEIHVFLDEVQEIEGW